MAQVHKSSSNSKDEQSGISSEMLAQLIFVTKFTFNSTRSYIIDFCSSKVHMVRQS